MKSSPTETRPHSPSALLHAIPHQRDPTARWMTGQYLVALGLVAALSVAAWVALHRTIAAQAAAAAIINVSGMRRYLSQRAALSCLQLAVPNDSKAHERARTEARETADRLEYVHNGLLHGDPTLHLPGNPSATVNALYFSGSDAVDPLVRDFLRRVRRLSDMPSVAQDDPDLVWILDVADGLLLTRLDQLVSAYQAESEAEIRRLQQHENLVLAATLLALTLEAFFIFRPMVRRVLRERARLVTAEGYLRSILDHCHDAVFVTAPDGSIEATNPAACRLLGLPRNDVIHQPFRNLITLTDGDADGVHSATATTPDGRQLRLDVGFGSMQALGGPRRIAIARESTAALQRYANDLERRNHELDQFAYVASHDLKAPLRAIANISTWIEDDLAKVLDDQNRAQMHLLRDRVRRLEGLIDGLHQYAVAGRRTGTVERVDLADLVREIASEQDNDSRFTITYEGDSDSIETDRVRLWQVVSNLIANAIRHHHRGHGHIVITTEIRDQQLLLSVTDDGPGIDPAHHERIFTIFHTLAPKDRAPGLGLGLALVRKILAERGGVITVHSQPGTGATFAIRWPLVPNARSAVPHSSDESSAVVA